MSKKHKKYLFLFFIFAFNPLFANTNVSLSSLSNFVYFQDGVRFRTDIAQIFEFPLNDSWGLEGGFVLGMATQPALTNYPGNLFHFNLTMQARYHIGNRDLNHLFAALNTELGWVAMPIPDTLSLYEWLPRFETGFVFGYTITTFTFRVKDIPMTVHLEPSLLVGESFYLYTGVAKTDIVTAGRLEFRLRFSFNYALKQNIHKIKPLSNVQSKNSSLTKEKESLGNVSKSDK